MRGHAVKNPPSPAQRLDRVFHALSSQTRRSLLARLTHGPAMVTDLAEPFAISLPAVSKHLQVLEAARLIVREVEGRVHRCALAPGPLEDAQDWLEYYRAFWEDALDALGRYAEGLPRPAHRPSRKRS